MTEKIDTDGSETGGIDISEASAIDSPCYVCADGTDAVTWITHSDGLRRYVCAEHAAEIATTAHDADALPAHPRAMQCVACGSLAPFTALSASGICPECGEARDPPPPE